jgi:23S rRNA (guanosine2251-2'-O)-methyltransferase
MKKLRLEELDRLSVEEFREIDKIPVVVLLDNVRSLHNVGSAFRTADAFRVEKIYLTGITGTPPHREIHKTALGATESVSWQFTESPGKAIEELIRLGYLIVVLEQTTESVPLHQFVPDPSRKYCLVFGNEVEGVSEEVLKLASLALEIPQAGTKHSLNVSVCVGITVWHFYSNLGLR